MTTTTSAVAVRLPKATIEALDELADALGTPTRAEAIRHVLRDQISSIESQRRIRDAVQNVLRADGPASEVLRVDVTDVLHGNLGHATVPGEGLSATLRRVLMSDWQVSE